MVKDVIKKSAWISDCGRYRHALGRHWDETKGYVLFIGLNPSTADAEKDDPTIRRCIRFARDWGYGGIEMCNLFDWRATDPKNLPRSEIAVSEKGEAVMRVRIAEASLIVAAWGACRWAESRIDHVFKEMFNAEKAWHCLGKTKDDFPRHPLYVPAATKPTIFW